MVGSVKKRSIFISLCLLIVLGAFQNCSSGVVEVLSSEANGIGYDGRPDLFPPIAFKNLKVSECNSEGDGKERTMYASVVFSPDEDYIQEVKVTEVSQRGFFKPRSKKVPEKLFKGNKLHIPLNFFGHPMIASEFNKNAGVLTIDFGATDAGTMPLKARNHVLHCREVVE